ncbi:MAG: hypothetical protein PHC62_02845 [Candidatus Izemoplasmatales bacterium]|jgi:hypothetical protein|nr:hypothetical protein [Candidatus Izemoplasmatales bacterium]
MIDITQKQLDNQEIALMGIKIASELLHISSVCTDFLGEDFFGGKQISSLFIPSIYKIVFNTLWMEKVNMEEVLASAFHETRHAYQKRCVDFRNRNDFKEDKETINLWENEFWDYAIPKDGTKCNESYLHQSIEIDAIAFSHMLLLHLFSIKTVIPKSVKDQVIERIADIQISPLWRGLKND